MDTIPSTEKLSDKAYSDDRKQLRKKLEREATGKKSDRVHVNDIVLCAIVLIAAAVSFTDFTLTLGDLSNFTALTVFLYMVTTFVYRNRYEKGRRKGMLEAEYIEALSLYRQRRQKINERGIASLVPDFCRDYKVSELRQYRESLLADVDMEYSEYKEKYQRMSEKSVMKQDLPLSVRKAIVTCNRAKPIRLAPGLILKESGETDREKLIGMSGRERERRDKRRQMIYRAIIVLFGSVVTINVILDFSIITVFQWLVRMIPIISAMLMGEDVGYCNIAVTETDFKKDQASVIDLFMEYADKKSPRGEDSPLGGE